MLSSFKSASFTVINLMLFISFQSTWVPRLYVWMCVCPTFFSSQISSWTRCVNRNIPWSPPTMPTPPPRNSHLSHLRQKHPHKHWLCRAGSGSQRLYCLPIPPIKIVEYLWWRWVGMDGKTCVVNPRGGHGYLITSCIFVWMWLLIHALNSLLV